jgi:Fe-S-cluster containining protein
VSSHACGGDCCRDFYLNIPPAEIGAAYLLIKAKQVAGEELTELQRDHIYIAEMVVRIDEDDEKSPRYTCLHFDNETGRCRSYDQRPAMCRDYPNYGKPDALPCFFCAFSESSPSLSPCALQNPELLKPAACP